MSYSWNHTICTLLRLASSLKHDVVGKKQTKKNVEYRYSIKYWGNLLKGRTWVWSNSGRQWRTGRAGVLQPMGSQSWALNDNNSKEEQNMYEYDRTYFRKGRQGWRRARHWLFIVTENKVTQRKCIKIFNCSRGCIEFHTFPADFCWA